MSDFTEFLVPSGFGMAELTEKKSKFIGRVWRVESEEEANGRIKEMREKHWDATHNVYAYIIKDGSLMRYSDDGEPRGTSGMPVLNVFRSASIFNVCCVVTRYFGGTLLGTGGLVRAYSKTASLALEEAGISVVKKWIKLRVKCPYNIYENLLKEFSRVGAVVSNKDYGENIVVSALLPEGSVEKFNKSLADISSGKVSAEFLSKDYLAAPVVK